MKAWTNEEIHFLVVCCEQQWTFAEIANELERTTKSVSHKCNKLKLLNGLSNNINKTTDQYKKELKIKCPTMICLGEYKTNRIPILHKCLKCDKEYKCTPVYKLQGDGCKYCGTSTNTGNIPANKKGITYLVYIPKYDLYKIGVTSKTVKERMSDNRLSEYDLILEHKFDLGKDAIILEKVWKENLKEYLVNTGLLQSGNTETFRI